MKKSLPPYDASMQGSGLPVRLIRGGRDFFELLLELIRNARSSIHLQTYILHDDETGLQIIDALEAASARGVDVYILADGYASRNLQQKTISSMRITGIRFRFFEPLFRSHYFYFGRRLHHKLFVADEQYALIGGINITDRYNDMPGKPAWLDLALLATGNIAARTATVCKQIWNNVRVPENKRITSPDSGKVMIRRNDWVRRYNEISGSYIDMLRHAKDHITIISSYFLPGKIIRRLLRSASQRGVNIRVITAGTSDVMISKHAERWMYDWLLRNGITLYEYQPVILHAKAAVCDSAWFTLGSYNLNNISTYASIELNLDVRDNTAAQELEAMLNRIITEDCIPVTHETHRHSKNPFIQLLRWISYHFIRVMFTLLTFYFKRER